MRAIPQISLYFSLEWGEEERGRLRLGMAFLLSTRGEGRRKKKKGRDPGPRVVDLVDAAEVEGGKGRKEHQGAV